MPHPRALPYTKIALIQGRVVECAVFLVKLIQKFTPKTKKSCQHHKKDQINYTRLFNIYIYIYIYKGIHLNKQGVCYSLALPFTLKCILRQKKNYGNSNISPCKKISNLQNKIP
jgi:hypothetical protein